MSVVRYTPYPTYVRLYTDYVNLLTELLKERGMPKTKACSDMEAALAGSRDRDPAQEIEQGLHSCDMFWEDFSRSDAVVDLGLEVMGGDATIRKIHLFKVE